MGHFIIVLVDSDGTHNIISLQVVRWMMGESPIEFQWKVGGHDGFERIISQSKEMFQVQLKL